jgi:hypothetical protein
MVDFRGKPRPRVVAKLHAAHRVCSRMRPGEFTWPSAVGSRPRPDWYVVGGAIRICPECRLENRSSVRCARCQTLLATEEEING